MHQRSELPSGIRVVTERVDGQRAVALGAWVRTGSRDEPAALSGATHFLEHLVFKGTPSRSAIGIAQAFDEVGGDLNAFTTKEATCFHARALAADVPMALDTIADMLQNATLEPVDVEAERNVVLEEIAMHSDAPDDIVFDMFQESIWPAHALGQRVQGTEETVAAMSRDAINGYYRTHYAPGNIVVAAAGPVAHADVVSIVDAAFGGPRAVPGARSGPPAFTAGLSVVERDIEQAHLVYGARGISRTDERRWALGVLNVALGGGMSSRLFQEIRERRGLAYAVSSGHQGFDDTGIFSVYAACSHEHVADVLALTREILDEIIARGPTEEEVARAIGHLRGSLLIGFDDPGSVMTHIGKSELCHKEILTEAELIERIERVTLDEVRAVALDVLKDPWALTILGPAIAADVSGFAA